MAQDFTRTLIRPISLKPPAEPAHRNAARVIAMVHELHKAGYQRIRILPFLAPNGLHWRCTICDAASLTGDGLAPSGATEGRLARYSSGDGARYFGWTDGPTLTARMMAHRFLKQFPLIAQHGAGRDWAYAGWLTDVLGRAEHGSFLALHADYPIPPEDLEPWLPPPVIPSDSDRD